MEIIRSLPTTRNKYGTCVSNAVFWCPYCKKEVVRQRSHGLRIDSCCMRSKKIKKRNTVDRICLGCDKTFKSEGKHNHLCVSCQISNDSIENSGYAVRTGHKLHVSTHRHAPQN